MYLVMCLMYLDTCSNRRKLPEKAYKIYMAENELQKLNVMTNTFPVAAS